MNMPDPDSPQLTVYTTAPSSNDLSGREFRQRAADVARWTEEAGHRGLLIYSDNSLVDPWQAAQFIIERTTTLVPLVAIQPLFRHPFDAARAISSLAYQYDRQIDLNLVSGGFSKNMRELANTLDHDDRYRRLVEYARIMSTLLASGRRPVSHEGEFYTLNKVRLALPFDTALTPRTYVAGSSTACIEAQQALGATRLCYPQYIGDYADTPNALQGSGIRLGIIARDTADEAWHVAHTRFPNDQLGEQLHDMAARQVESRWHQNLSAEAQSSAAPRDGYWLYPFRAYKTFCPYLIGSHQDVADMLAQYRKLGVDVLVLDVPHDEEDLAHIGTAIALAERVAFAH